MVFTASEREIALDFTEKRLLLGTEYDTVLTTAVVHKEKTNELTDNIFTVGVKTPPFWPLPAFLLRHIWLCQLDSGLYAVAVWSFVFHGLWLGARNNKKKGGAPNPRKMGAPKVGALKGGGPKVGPEGWAPKSGAPEGWGPKTSLFFSLSRHIFLSSWRSVR